MYCGWCDLQSLCNLTLRTLFFFNLGTHSFHRLESLCSYFWETLPRGLHRLLTEARTWPVAEIVWPNPKSFPSPQWIAKKKKKKGCISWLHATVSKQIHKETDSSRLGHFTRQNKKHLPVMKVCEHQVQRSHTFCRFYEWLYGQDDNSSIVQIMHDGRIIHRSLCSLAFGLL